MGRAGRGLAAVLALAALGAAVSCSSGSSEGAGLVLPSGDSTSGAGEAAGRPVVEVGDAPADPQPYLAADADPTTALGRLRARHLPVWTPDFDWAFPPEVCNSAWELDGIAEPAGSADIAVTGDFATAAALTVMRYEHQLSRALADPSPLAQLCVATATVEPARAISLEALASHLESGSRRAEPAAYPGEAWIVAVGPTSALSVACVTPGYPSVVAHDGEVIEASPSPARLEAYLLTVSRGLEDRVADISYRVSNTTGRPAENCESLDAWADEWDGHVQTWMAEGQIWEPLDVILTADEICQSPPPDGPDECPEDWPQ